MIVNCGEWLRDDIVCIACGTLEYEFIAGAIFDRVRLNDRFADARRMIAIAGGSVANKKERNESRILILISVAIKLRLPWASLFVFVRIES